MSNTNDYDFSLDLATLIAEAVGNTSEPGLPINFPLVPLNLVDESDKFGVVPTHLRHLLLLFDQMLSVEVNSANFVFELFFLSLEKYVSVENDMTYCISEDWSVCLLSEQNYDILKNFVISLSAEDFAIHESNKSIH